MHIYNIIRGRHIVLSLIFLLCVAISSGFGAHAQNAGDMEITEVMYHPKSGGEWIEVVNISAAAINMTTLKVGVGSAAKQSITVDGTTPASLPAGGIAVIAKNTTTFKAAYSGYSGNLYSSAFSLPDTNGTEVALYDSAGTVKVHTVTYNTDPRTNGTGSSLHVGLNGLIIPGPATPGALEVNPITQSYAQFSGGVAVASSITGSTDATGFVFLDAADVITLQVLHPEALPDNLTAKVTVGGTEKTMTASAGATAIRKNFTYTVVSGDTDGRITYTILSSGSVIKSGAVTHQGKVAAIDKTAPTLSFAMEAPNSITSRKQVTVTVTDTSPPEEVEYKIHTAACTTSLIYAAASDAKTIPVVTKTGEGGAETHTASAILFGTEYNTKYFCVKATDRAGRVAYSASPQITGITALTAEITELSYVTDEGGEWIEIVNSGSSSVTVTDLTLRIGSNTDSITHRSGATALANGDVAVIVKNSDLSDFRREYPSYDGPLFTAYISLTDAGSTITLRDSEKDIDSVTYAKSDGAFKNGNTLHVLSTGEIVEGPPTPGTAPVASGRTQRSSVSSPRTEQIARVNADLPTMRVRQFDGSESNVTPGQNIFFTSNDTVQVQVIIDDDDTRYTSANVNEKVVTVYTMTVAGKAQVERVSRINYYNGNAYLTYTIKFYHVGGSAGDAEDNRVTLNFTITDADGTVGSKRNRVTVVRRSTAPSLVSATSATVLGFAAAAADNIVVPVTVSNIAFGDWARVSYAGSCNDGRTNFMARNGGQGVVYGLETGDSHTDCAVQLTDSAGNAGSSLTLPQIIVGE